MSNARPHNLNYQARRVLELLRRQLADGEWDLDPHSSEFDAELQSWVDQGLELGAEDVPLATYPWKVPATLHRVIEALRNSKVYELASLADDGTELRAALVAWVGEACPVPRVDTELLARAGANLEVEHSRKALGELLAAWISTDRPEDLVDRTFAELRDAGLDDLVLPEGRERVLDQLEKFVRASTVRTDVAKALQELEIRDVLPEEVVLWAETSSGPHFAVYAGLADFLVAREAEVRIPVHGEPATVTRRNDVEPPPGCYWLHVLLGDDDSLAKKSSKELQRLLDERAKRGVPVVLPNPRIRGAEGRTDREVALEDRFLAAMEPVGEGRPGGWLAFVGATGLDDVDEVTALFRRWPDGKWIARSDDAVVLAVEEERVDALEALVAWAEDPHTDEPAPELVP